MRIRLSTLVLLLVSLALLPGCGSFSADSTDESPTNGDEASLGEVLDSSDRSAGVIDEAIDDTRPVVAEAPETPMPIETPRIIGDLDVSLGDLSDQIVLPPSMEELIEMYPELEPLQRNLDLTDQATLEEIYPQLIELYNNEGVLGLHQLMLSSGILEGLGLHTDYIDFVLAYEEMGWDGADAYARARGLVTSNDELRLVLVLDSEETSEVKSLVSELDAIVLREYENEVEVGIPLAILRDAAESKASFLRLVALAQLPGVVKVRVPLGAISSQFDQVGEGPAVIGADELHEAGIIGDGVKVGIIDPDGFFGLLNLVDVSLPPAERIFLPEWADPEYLSEETFAHGSAVAEVVYEMAPGVELYLAHATTYLELAEAVDWMILNEVDIINYSAVNMFEPNDGTGWSVDIAHHAFDNGILWVNAMGNEAQAHLDMVYTDENEDGFHEFPHGDELFPIVPRSTYIELSISWDEPWEGATQDYDLFLFREVGDELEVVSSSRAIQAGGSEDIPMELIRTEVDPDDEVLYVAIQAHDVTEPVRFNMAGYAVFFDYTMPEGSVSSPADGERVLSVGATHWSDDALEPYSSQGPTQDGRIKPEIVAPADVSNTLYENGFNGTSASAPHVAGAAALLFGAAPSLSNAAVIDLLTDNSVDLGEEGLDNQFGFGRVDFTGDFRPRVEGGGTGEPAGEVLAVYDYLNVEVGRDTGMLLIADILVEEIEEGTIEVDFADERGQVLVTVRESFTTGQSEPLYITGVELFASYSEFDLPLGESEITYSATILDGSGSELDSGGEGVVYLTVTDPEAAEPVADISNVLINQNVIVDGVPGIEIELDLDLVNAAGRDTEVIAVFFEDSARENPLKDFNGRYQLDGMVATGVILTPESDDESYRGGTLFIPNEELHLDDEARYKLKILIGVFVGSEDEDPIYMSDWINFRVDTGTWD